MGNPERKLSRRDFIRATAGGLGAVIGGGFLSSCRKIAHHTATPIAVSSEAAAGPHPVLGIARGIYPGRVVWAYNPKATRWDGKSGFWWQVQNTDQALVEEMCAHSIRRLTGETKDAHAWAAMFEHFNVVRGNGVGGYQPGERIAVKVNLNGSGRHAARTNHSIVSPHVAMAVLKQLVIAAKVPTADITVFDATRHVPDCLYDYCRTPELAGVRFADWAGGDGREACRRDTRCRIHWSQDVKGNLTYLPTCVTEAKYLINLASLKGHNLACVTLCGKNHFGTIQTDLKGQPTPYAPEGANLHDLVAAQDHESGPNRMQRRRPMGTYNPLVDLMGHSHLGEKTVLFMLDGLYVAHDQGAELSNASRWQSAPFNQGWPSSILASQDGVAIDSVGVDFLSHEPTILGLADVMSPGNTCDNYLHEAAQANRPPSGTLYNPQGDGNAMPSLGVHEHWRSPKDRQYSRNLGEGKGIELAAIA